jgi:hypothetical protein
MSSYWLIVGHVSHHQEGLGTQKRVCIHHFRALLRDEWPSYLARLLKSTSLRLGCDSFRHHLRIIPSWRARIAEKTKLEVNQPDKLVNQYLHFCLEVWTGRDEEIFEKAAMFCLNG